MNQIHINIWFAINAIKKNFVLFVSIQIAVVVGTVIYSLFLKDEYEARTTFYPYSAEASDPRIMLYQEATFSIFGYSDQVERFMTYAKSRDILFYLTEKYDLINRWEIDTTKKKWKQKLLLKYANKVQFGKGPHGSIEMAVFDTDPDTAAIIANDIVTKIDEKARTLIKQRNKGVLEMYKNSHDEMLAFVNSIKDSIILYKNDKEKAKLFDYQLEQSYEGYVKMKLLYEQAKSLAERNLVTLQVAEIAEVPYKKAKPARTIMVISAFLISIFASAILFSIVAIIQNNKTIKEI